MNEEPTNSSGVWVDASKELPPEGEYVLIHLTKSNWIDSTDPNGVYYKVAKLQLGISMADREKMKAGELPDQESHGWIMPNNRPERRTDKRSSIYTGADEHANNLRPYQWVNFGPGNYFGQEVDYWMRIPPMNEKNTTGTEGEWGICGADCYCSCHESQYWMVCTHCWPIGGALPMDMFKNDVEQYINTRDFIIENDYLLRVAAAHAHQGGYPKDFVHPLAGPPGIGDPISNSYMGPKGGDAPVMIENANGSFSLHGFLSKEDAEELRKVFFAEK